LVFLGTLAKAGPRPRTTARSREATLMNLRGVRKDELTMFSFS